MDVLLTGFTGRVGPTVLNELLSAGHRVHGLVQPEIELSRQTRGCLDDVLYGDIRDITAWRTALREVETVVHLAGIAVDAPDAFDTNVTSTRLMTQACQEVGVRSIVFASSNCVLGQCNREGNPPFDLESLPVDESHPLKPHADYGLSKLVAEQVLHAAARRWGIRVIALRPAYVLVEEAVVDESWRELGEAWGVAHLWAYTHVLDFALAFRLALESAGSSCFEAMYISAADTLSDAPTRELVERYYPAFRDYAAVMDGYTSLFSWKCAESVIGFRPTRSWRD